MMNTLRNFYASPRGKAVLAAGVFLGLVFYAGFIRAPYAFPSGTLITIADGTTVRDAAMQLEKEHVVASSFMFELLARHLAPHGVRSGTYSFESHLSIFQVWWRVAHGHTGAPTVRVTVPEGATTREIGDLFAAAVPGFDAEKFRMLAAPEEGYLFPETYIVAPGITEEGVIALMEKTFDEKVATIQDDIDAFGKPLADVVTMASILEKEARVYETRQTVAGILWKRISIGMPLQVDAVFGYIYGTETFSPTFNQLTATDSPYNTYKYKGLPPGPIGNPGLDALKAAVHPIETPYLYYLTGSDGVMHYAKTFDEHVANRRFLR